MEYTIRSSRRAIVIAVALALSLIALLASTADRAIAAVSDVVISEIMYNPENDLDTDEFLEIHNSGAETIDIGGWCVDGASFCFPAGTSIAADEYLVISPDAARLSEVYGVTSAGTYDGGLKNGGETVQLLDAAGAVIHEFSYDDGGAWPTLPDGEGPSLELMALDARSSSWGWVASSAAAGHTAGGANSTWVAGTPPSITDVAASATAPGAGEAVTITATITNATNTPRLVWRTDLGSDNSIAMSGVAPSFTATVPGQSAGTLLEYRIETEGAFDHSWPRHDDSRATLGIFYPRNLATDLPVFEWFIRDADYDSMITDHLEDDQLFESVLVVGDEVMTGAKVRVRGSSSRFLPKVNFKWELPQGHDLEGVGLLIEAVDEFAMQAEYGERSYGRSLLAWRAFEMAGIPTAQAFKVRVERNGQFQGLYSYTDTYDKTWRKRYDIEENGSFYKAQSGGFSQHRKIEKRWDLKEGTQGFAPLEAMLDVIVDGTPAEREAYVRANFDVPQMIDYASVTALSQHVDSSTKNFYAYLPDATGKWQLIPWDLDHTWGYTCCPVFSDFVTPAEPGDKVNLMIEALLSVDEYEAQYFVRVKELRDQILAPGLLEGIFDAEVGIAAPEAALDKAIWGQCCSVSFDRNELFEDIQARRDVFDNDPRVGGGPTPEDFECSASDTAGDAVVTFSGDRGTREQLRSAGQGWIATITGQATEMVPGGAGDPYFTRLRGNGYSDTPEGYTDVPCDAGDPDPDPDEFECTVAEIGGDAVVFFDGPRGTREQLRSAGEGWIATVSDQATEMVSGGAGDSYFTRLRGNGYSDTPEGYTDVSCT